MDMWLGLSVERATRWYPVRLLYSHLVTTIQHSTTESQQSSPQQIDLNVLTWKAATEDCSLVGGQCHRRTVTLEIPPILSAMQGLLPLSSSLEYVAQMSWDRPIHGKTDGIPSVSRETKGNLHLGHSVSAVASIQAPQVLLQRHRTVGSSLQMRIRRLQGRIWNQQSIPLIDRKSPRRVNECMIHRCVQKQTNVT